MVEISNAPLAGKRLLVVEDDYIIALSVAEVLKDHGAVVIGPAGRLDDALALLSQDQLVDAGVLDIRIMGEQAYPIADRLVARNVPFVFFSSCAPQSLAPNYRHHTLVEKPAGEVSIITALVAKTAGGAQPGSKWSLFSSSS